jgi:hypothetical protein
LQSELNGNFWRLVPINIDSVDDKIIQYWKQYKCH